MDLASNFFVLCLIMKVYLYLIINGGWSLAFIFMKERVNVKSITDDGIHRSRKIKIELSVNMVKL